MQFEILQSRIGTFSNPPASGCAPQLDDREFSYNLVSGTNRSASVGRSLHVLCLDHRRIRLGISTGGKDGG